MSEATTQTIPAATDEITPQAHRKLAVALFNAVWDLIDKTERTSEEEAAMIRQAHASCYHWSLVGTPKNVSIGEWQVAHVYTILQHGQPALYHAERCLELSRQHDVPDWALAFAYEAVARAYACRHEAENCRHYRAEAARIGETIAEEGERTHFQTELAKGPWFGIV